MSTPAPIPDTRTYNEKVLAQIRDLLLGKSLDGVASYKIGTRELIHIPLPELSLWEAQVEARVKRERLKKLGKPARGAYVIFGSAASRGIHFAGARLLLGRLLRGH